MVQRDGPVPTTEDRALTLLEIQWPSTTMTRPRSVAALAALEVLMAAMAIPSSLLLLLDPTGSLVGGQFILPYLGAAAPFLRDFTPVGVRLVVVYGALPMIPAFGLLRNQRWAWLASAALGVLEVSWIAVEIAMFYPLGFNPMYPLIGGIGTASLLMSFFPPIREQYSTREVPIDELLDA